MPIQLTPVSPGETLLLLCGLVLLAAPGVLVLRRNLPALVGFDRIWIGLALGVAIQLIGFSVTMWFGVTLQWLVVAMAVAWGLYSAWGGRRDGGLLGEAPSREEKLFLLVAAAQFALFCVTVSHSALPTGNDAVYHVAIADKFVATRTLPHDFWPYDPSPPNYPAATHWLCAFFSVVSGVAVHRVYQWLMVFGLVFVSGLVFSLGAAVFDARVGLAAAFCFAFLGNWGSLDLLRWGSLPNLAGVIFTLAFLRLMLLACRGDAKPPVWVAAALFAALLQSHHLSALNLGLLYAVYAAAALAGRAPLTRSQLGFAVRSFALGLVVSLPFLAWFVPAALSRVLSHRPPAGEEIRGAAYFDVAEKWVAPWIWPEAVGYALFAFAVVGAWRLFSGDTPRKDGREAREFFVLWILGVALPYLLLDYVVRAAVFAITQISLAVFTPSRLLSAMVYPGSVVAGVGLAWLAGKRAAVLAVVVPAALWLALRGVMPLWRPVVTEEEGKALAAFAAASPPDAVLLGNPAWSIYLTRREGTKTALREEELTPYTERKRTLSKGVLTDILAWMKEEGRPAYLWLRKPVDDPSVEAVWKGEHFFVYRVRDPRERAGGS